MANKHEKVLNCMSPGKCKLKPQWNKYLYTPTRTAQVKWQAIPSAANGYTN